MKRLILTILAVLAVTGASAQSGAVESVSLNIGGYPFMEMMLYGSPFCDCFDVEILRPSLMNLYSDKKGPVWSTGTIALQADFGIKKWLSIPMILTGNMIFQKSVSNAGNDSYLTTNITSQIMSGFRIKYMNKPKVNFYYMICFGLGIASDDYREELSFSDGTETEYHVRHGHTSDITPAFQVVPFGIRFGGKIYGTAEIGAGTSYLGGMLGIGIKL